MESFKSLNERRRSKVVKEASGDGLMKSQQRRPFREDMQINFVLDDRSHIVASSSDLTHSSVSKIAESS